eukprot:scaffold64630_cov30-Tisochrysis_lutea.AAC.8
MLLSAIVNRNLTVVVGLGRAERDQPVDSVGAVDAAPGSLPVAHLALLLDAPRVVLNRLELGQAVAIIVARGQRRRRCARTRGRRQRRWSGRQERVVHEPVC